MMRHLAKQCVGRGAVDKLWYKARKTRPLPSSTKDFPRFGDESSNLMVVQEDLEAATR